MTTSSQLFGERMNGDYQVPVLAEPSNPDADFDESRNLPPDSPADLEFWAWIDDHSERHMPGKHNQKDHGHPGDQLGLSDRISLGPGESLAGSAAFSGRYSDFEVVVAAVSGGPGGGHVRVGVVVHGDGRRWSAGDKGGTAHLDNDSAKQLHEGLKTANAKGKERAAFVDKHRDNMDMNDVDSTTHQGVIKSSWGDVHYQVHATDDEPSSWSTGIRIRPKKAGVDPEEAWFTPGELGKLVNGLGQMLDLIE